jgi:hypothetical protein
MALKVLRKLSKNSQKIYIDIPPVTADGTGSPRLAASAAPILQTSRSLSVRGSMCRPPPDLMPETQGSRQSGA